MFNGNRYVTRGVASEVDGCTQLVMWGLIDGLNIRKDYLQVFKLSYVNVNGVDMQLIQHAQEQPAFGEEVLIPAENPVCLTVFAIDDGDHCTMLLNSEY